MRAGETLKPPPWPLCELALAMWLVRTIWWHQLGRWHVFRGVPDWALIRIAAVDLTSDADADARSYARAANEELRLRLMTLQRDVERLEREALAAQQNPTNEVTHP